MLPSMCFFINFHLHALLRLCSFLFLLLNMLTHLLEILVKKGHNKTKFYSELQLGASPSTSTILECSLYADISEFGDGDITTSIQSGDMEGDWRVELIASACDTKNTKQYMFFYTIEWAA
ncbi:hypothetical protein ACJX0J_028105, partial [Zea mays]